jgi:acyl-CoA synthetase (NDP forming)
MDEIGLPRHGGKIAIITQSGGVCAGVCGSLTNLWVQIDFALAIGNSMGLDIDQLAAYVAARDKTTISFYYLEKNPGRLFVDLIAATTPRKPVVVFKGARHDENTAAATHTGSISSDNDVLACALENAGAIVVQDEIVASLLLGMLENGMATRLAEKIHTARAEGRPEPGVLIVTQSGADGVLTMDHTLDRKASFRLAKPASKHVAEIQALIGPTISIQPNPVDTGPTGNMERICQILTADQDVGLTLLAIRRPFAPSLIPDREKTGDDVVLVFPNSGSRRVFVHAVDEKHWIVSNDPQKVLDAFAHVYHYARFLADKSP